MKTLILTLALICFGLNLRAQTTVSYTYDNLNRLSQAMYSTGVTILYTYDALGNRTQHVISCIAPAQPNAITGSISVCPNSTQTYSVPAVPGAAYYTWSLPNGWSGTSTTNSITVTAGSSGGTISVTASNGCGTSIPRTLSVSMLSVPNQPSSISGNSPVCAGSSNTYSVNAVAGATSYTWTLPNGWTGSSTTNSITTTAGTSGGTITVVANNACGSSPVRTRNLSITPLPAQPSSISGLASVCQGSTQTYSVNAVSGATSYTWTLPNGWTGTSTTNSITCTAGATGGTISVTANNACGPGVARTLSVSISPLPNQPSTISGSNNICAGTTQTYSVNAVSGAISYTWTLPIGWTGSSTTNSITCVVGNAGGTISVVANNSCGAGSVRNRTINVVNIPESPVAINGVLTACEATQQNFSVPTVSGATSYTWTLPNGWSGSSTTSSINATLGSESGTITITSNNNCGSSAATSLAVVSNPLPGAIQQISGEGEVCQSTNEVYMAGNSTNATWYYWGINGDANGSSMTNTIDLTFGTDLDPITLVAQGMNDCGAGNPVYFYISVYPLPASAGSIDGQFEVCQGETGLMYEVPNINFADEYIWTLSDGSNVSTSNNQLSLDIANSGQSWDLSVHGLNACGMGASSSAFIIVNPLPGQAASISGLDNVCVGSDAVAYFVQPIANAVDYHWELSGGLTGASTTNIIFVEFDPTPGTELLTVRGQNDCGLGEATSKLITINPIPEAPVISFVNGSLVSSAPFGNQWYNQSGILIGAVANQFTPSENGVYSVTVTVNGCTSDLSEPFNLTNLSLEDKDNANHTITVFPNPFENTLRAISEKEFITTLRVLDLQGKVIHKLSPNKNEVYLDLGELSGGLYILEMETVSGMSRVSVVKR